MSTNTTDQVIIQSMMNDPIAAKDIIIDYSINILLAILILVIGNIIAKQISKLIRKSMQKSGKLDDMLTSFLSKLIYALLMAFVCISALGKIGIPTASIVAALGACVLAVGFALQGSLSNFASGILIIIMKPFKVGDFIEAGGTSGIVEDVSIFTTELKTPDNKKIIIPNTPIMSGSITNYSHYPSRRVEVMACVSYGSDIDKVRKVLNDIIKDCKYVLQEPEPAIVLKTLNDSSVDFAVRVWVKTADYWSTLFELQETIKKTFDANDIEIPFPQTDVHLHNQ